MSSVNPPPRPPIAPDQSARPLPPGMSQAIEVAKRFYAADSQLSTEDRSVLAKSFTRRMIAAPLLGLPALYLGIKAPLWLQQRGFLIPKKNYRGMQVLLGMSALFVGQGTGGMVTTAYYQNRFDGENRNMGEVWRLLKAYPSRIGNRYYGLTAKQPEYAMRDPATINWREEFMFPFNLVFQRQGPRPGPWGNRQPPPGQPGQPAQYPDGTNPAYPARQQSPAGGGTYGPVSGAIAAKDKPFGSGSDGQYDGQMDSQSGTPETGSSWDRIRAQNQRSSEDMPDLEREQADFDAMLERARRGEGVGDDFSESERNWK